MLEFRPIIEDNSCVDGLDPVVENPRDFGRITQCADYC